MSAPLSGSERVLAVLPAWLGDVVQCEPGLRALHARVGERLSIAGPPALVGLFDGGFDGARRIPHRGSRANADDWRGHDVALLFPGSFRSAWTALRAGIPRRVGWSRDARGWLLTDRMRPPRERGAVPLGLGRVGRAPRILPRSYVGACVELCGLVGVSVADTRPRLPLDRTEIDRARARLAGFGLASPGGDGADSIDTEGHGRGAWMLACAGGRPGSAKAFPPARWAVLFERLVARTGLPIVATAGPGEEDGLRAALERLGPGAPVHACLEPVAGLAELCALAAGCAVAVVTDSGPRHVAAAMGAPLVVLTGPTDPRHSADHLESQAVLRTEVDCGPCHLERCPIEGVGRQACMERLDLDAAVDRAAALLAQGRDRARALGRGQ